MKVNIHKHNASNIPAQLQTVDRPPEQLFIKGVPLEEWLGKPKLGVVGSRKMSAYGAAITEDLVSRLAAAGVVIVSGLAYGVDAAAHRAALSAGGSTVAVLPTSLSNIYPAAHTNLAAQIMTAGTLISEYSAGDPVYKTNFTDRNRLIAGLSDALLITEAAINSGSLHTARHCLNQGKTVMAVPGNITSPGSEGCNNLIKSGAIPVTDANDVFFALGLNPEKVQKRHFRGSSAEHQIYTLIAEGITDQEQLALRANLPGAAAASLLTGLEINGYIRPLGAGHWTVA
jgi:DNA processing protein